MKTEHLVGNNSDPIWASNVELLPSEECLPVIGSCQVSSILQNLDTTNDHNLQSMDLIILHGNDYKIPLDAPLNLQTNNYIVLKDSIPLDTCNSSPGNESSSNGSFRHTPQKCPEKLFDKHPCSAAEDSGLKNYSLPSEKHREEPKNLEPTDLSLNITETSNSSNTSSISPKHYDKESFEDMLYFVCNLCPFLCTKEAKITEHLESIHKNKTISKLVQLKCPACANIFYHRASLKSHLLHDHCVANADLNLIVQAVVFYSNKENKKETDTKSDENTKNDIKTQNETKSNSYNGKNLEIKYLSTSSNSVGPTNSTNNISECTTGIISKVKAKDITNLVKPIPKLVTSKLVDLDSSSETSENFDLQNHAENQSAPVQNIMPLSQKIPLPQVDISPNNSEKLITNLMKKTEHTVKYYSQKCVFSNCKVLLTDSKKMDYHIECHWNEGLRCLECQEKFMLWKPLTSHLWRLHKIDMELYSCDKCDYKTNSLSNLNTIHKLIHSTIKAFQCDICQKSFKNQKQLRNHKRIHRQDVQKEVTICELCSKSFRDRTRLKSHMDSVHKKLKPYLCNYCGYKGSCRASLRMHIRSHTGEKPFSCDQCQYTTSDHNSLRRHKLRHTGQKPYKCSYCPYACIQSSTYKVHLKTKHPGLEKDLMFTCFICQYRTVNKDMYNSHMVTIHKQKPSSGLK